jgi:hypothetical protein
MKALVATLVCAAGLTLGEVAQAAQISTPVIYGALAWPLRARRDRRGDGPRASRGPSTPVARPSEKGDYAPGPRSME